jgi:phosphoenolpyruvate-protein phosphotransferase (PTS system enzyme I)
MEKVVKGIVASNGIAIGKAYLVSDTSKVNTRIISANEIPEQIKKLKMAIILSTNQLEQIEIASKNRIAANELKIIESIKELLNDITFIDKIINFIKKDKITADNAVNKAVEDYSNLFLAMEDEYLQQKSSDIKDVGMRIIDKLSGEDSKGINELTEASIIIAHDLFPSDTIQMDKSKVLGFATDLGGKTSHTAIIATALEIPAIVATNKVTQILKSGDMVIIDGEEGNVLVNPDVNTLEIYQKKSEENKKHKETLSKFKSLLATTTDGYSVKLFANIGSIEDSNIACENCADGIGLLRTEFLYIGKDRLPTEEEQFKAYKVIAEKMDGKPLIIRTLDIGGDKNVPYLKVVKEANPFLGVRGIRLCFENIEVFKDQIRAILRAGSFGNVKMMFPMVTTLNEVRRAKDIVNEVKNELNDKKILFDSDIEIGIMVEVPTVALSADLFIKEVDFFSIGSNDLTQYTMATDRMNEKLVDLYSPYNLSIFRLIKKIVDASHKSGKWTGICGQIAAEPYFITILLGLGVDEFSVPPSLLNETKSIIRSMSVKKAQEITEEVMGMDTVTDIYSYLKEAYKENFSKIK